MYDYWFVCTTSVLAGFTLMSEKNSITLGFPTTVSYTQLFKAALNPTHVNVCSDLTCSAVPKDGRC